MTDIMHTTTSNTIGMSALSSKMISFMRFPLALAIVFQHSYYCISSAQPVEITFSWQLINLMRGFFSWIINGSTLCAFAVISGYLFFQHWENDNNSKTLQWSWRSYGKKLYSRIWGLLIPYILWNLLTAWYMHSPITWHIFYNQNIWGGEQINLFGQHLFPTIAPIDAPFWFVKDLIYFSIIAPIIYALVRYGKWGSLVFVAIIWTLHWPAWMPSQTLLPWFVCGAYLSINRMDLAQTARNLWHPLLWIGIAAQIATLYLDGWALQITKPLLLAIQCLFYFWSASYIAERKIWETPEWLTASSIILYASHAGLGLLNKSAEWMTLLFPDTVPWYGIILRYFLTPLLCSGVIVLCVKLIWPSPLVKLLAGKYKPSLLHTHAHSSNH